MPFPVGSSAPRSSNMIFDGDLRVPAGFKLVTPQIDALSSTIDVNAVQVNANTELQVAEGNILFANNIQAVGSDGIDIDYANPISLYLAPVSSTLQRGNGITLGGYIAGSANITLFEVKIPIPLTRVAGTCTIKSLNTVWSLFSGSPVTCEYNGTLNAGSDISTAVVGTNSFCLYGTVQSLVNFADVTFNVPAGSRYILLRATGVRTSGSGDITYYASRSTGVGVPYYTDTLLDYYIKK